MNKVKRNIDINDFKDWLFKISSIKQIILWMISPFILSLIPLSALVFYMQFHGFFSYDFFTEGLFSQKIFFIYFVLIIIFASLVMTGAIVPFLHIIFNYSKFNDKYRESVLVDKNRMSMFLDFFCNFKNKKFDLDKESFEIIDKFYKNIGLFIIIFSLNGLMIYQLSCNENLKPFLEMYIYIITLSILLNIHISFHVNRNINRKFYSLFIITALSIIIMGIMKEKTSALLEVGFSYFNIAGINVKVKYENEKDNRNGKLILLSPRNIYLKNLDNKLIIIERNKKEIMYDYKQNN